jgi:hypothetical protein
LHDRQRVGGSSLRLVERGQIIQRYRGIGMVGAERGFADRRRALVERFGIAVATLPLVQIGEIVQRARATSG